MRTIILLCLVAVVGAFVGYFAGSKFAPGPPTPAPQLLALGPPTPAAPLLTLGARESEQRMLQNDLRSHIQLEQEAYQFLTDGKTQRAKDEILIVLWWDTDYYEHAYGVPTGVDRFPDIFAKAKKLVEQIPIEVRTNAITFEPQLKTVHVSNNIATEKR